MADDPSEAHIDTRRPTAQAIAHREAIVLAARDLFAESGPAAVSIRAVAQRAGCAHTLVGRYFGSKAGLEAAVIERLAIGLKVLTTRMCSSETWPMSILVETLRHHPQARRLLSRCALGEFDPASLLTGHTLGECLAGRLEHRRGGSADHPGLEARIAAHCALATVLGLVSFESWIVAGSRAESITTERLDAIVADAAEAIAALAVRDGVPLPADTSPTHQATPHTADLTSLDSRQALIRATIELLAESGRAGLATREIASRASVNQGMIYHLFGSRERLFAEAISTAHGTVESAAAFGAPLDFVAATRALHQAKSIPLTARLLVNGVDLMEVRTKYPVFDRMFADLEPSVGRTVDDPQPNVIAASCLALGATLWDDLLRRMIGIPLDVDLTEPIAAMTRFALHRPSSSPDDGGQGSV